MDDAEAPGVRPDDVGGDGLPMGRDANGATPLSPDVAKQIDDADPLALLARQRLWDAQHATDPTEVAQGPRKGQPDGLPRVLAVVLSIAGAGGVIWLFHTLSWLIGPVFLGLTLVIAIYPVYSALVERKAPRWVAALAMSLVLLAILTAGVLATIWAVSSIANMIPSYIPAVTSMYSNVLAWLISKGVDQTALSSMVTRVDPKSLLGAAGTMLSSLSGVIGTVAVLLSALLMMMIDTVGFSHRLLLAGQTHPRAVAAMRGFAHGVRRYWVVSSIFGAIMASLNWVELTFMHVPLVGVWVLLTFITTFIPNIGFFFAMVPPVLMALVANGWQNAVTLLALYFVTTWIVQGVFQPKFAGSAVGVNTTISFLSFLLWAWVFGPLGTLIALPLTLLVKSLLVDADPRARWLNALLAATPSTKGAEPQV